MPRYKLMVKFPGDNEEHEVLGQRRSTKADIEKWVEDNTKACGLDWRIGYMLKLRDCDAIYQWRWISTGMGIAT